MVAVWVVVVREVAERAATKEAEEREEEATLDRVATVRVDRAAAAVAVRIG